MDGVGVLLGVLLVFFASLVAFIVLGRRGSFSSSDGDTFERVIAGASNECDVCDEMSPLNDVSEMKVALHGEKCHFSDNVVEKSNNKSISECIDSQDYTDDGEFDGFSLRDGVLYSIILEKRQF